MKGPKMQSCLEMVLWLILLNFPQLNTLLNFLFHWKHSCSHFPHLFNQFRRCGREKLGSNGLSKFITFCTGINISVWMGKIKTMSCFNYEVFIVCYGLQEMTKNGLLMLQESGKGYLMLGNDEAGSMLKELMTGKFQCGDAMTWCF